MRTATVDSVLGSRKSTSSQLTFGVRAEFTELKSDHPEPLERRKMRMQSAGPQELDDRPRPAGRSGW